MEKYFNIKETQNISLDMMKSFHAYCEENQLKYSLAWGSLLGAIRHKGFIPWDNDIDILMPRDDLERLMKLVKSKPINDNIQIIDFHSQKSFHYTIARAFDRRTSVAPSYLLNQIDEMGVWIDIFPLDGYNAFLYLLQKPIIWFFNEMLMACNYKLNPEWKVKNFLQKIILRVFSDKNNQYERIIESVAQWKKYSKSKKITYLLEQDINSFKFHFDKSDMDNLVLADFEDTKFYIFPYSNKMLEVAYGKNYMELPPVEKRFTHDINAEWKR